MNNQNPKKNTKATIDEDKLLQAALKEFSNKSYQNSSVNQIIQLAGIAKGSFYYRFKSKYDLYLYLLKSLNEKKWEYISSQTAKMNTTPKNLFDLLSFQIQTGVQFGKQYPQYQLLSQQFSKEKGNEIYQRVLVDLKQNTTSPLTQMIQTAIKNGEISAEFSVDFTQKLIEGMFQYFDQIFMNHDQNDSQNPLEKSEEFANQLVLLLKKGLLT